MQGDWQVVMRFSSQISMNFGKVVVNTQSGEGILEKKEPGERAKGSVWQEGSRPSAITMEIYRHDNQESRGVFQAILCKSHPSIFMQIYKPDPKSAMVCEWNLIVSTT